jgi:hypothetical protein
MAESPSWMRELLYENRSHLRETGNNWKKTRTHPPSKAPEQSLQPWKSGNFDGFQCLPERINRRLHLTGQGAFVCHQRFRLATH